MTERPLAPHAIDRGSSDGQTWKWQCWQSCQCCQSFCHLLGEQARNGRRHRSVRLLRVGDICRSSAPVGVRSLTRRVVREHWGDPRRGGALRCGALPLSVEKKLVTRLYTPLPSRRLEFPLHCTHAALSLNVFSGVP